MANKRITYPAVESAQFTRFGRTWVVRLHADDLDRVVKAGGLTVAKRDGSKSRQNVVGVRELKSGATTWENGGVTWAAVDVEAHPDEAAAYEAAKAERAAERKAAKGSKSTAPAPAPDADDPMVKVAAAMRAAGCSPAEIAAALADLSTAPAPAPASKGRGKANTASKADEVAEILADA